MKISSASTKRPKKTSMSKMKGDLSSKGGVGKKGGPGGKH